MNCFTVRQLISQYLLVINFSVAHKCKYESSRLKICIYCGSMVENICSCAVFKVAYCTLSIFSSDQQSVILGFIPRAVVNNLKNGQPNLFQEHKAAVIICV